MADTDVDKDGNPIAPGTGIPAAGSQEQAGLEGLDELTLARRRQAGADARAAEEQRKREAAEREAASLREQLAASKPKGGDPAPLDEAAVKRITEEAEARANARYLERVYPTARSRFPEVTDEARLAELETLFGKSETDENPAPRGNNGPRAAGSGEPGERTSKQMFEDLKKGGLPWTPLDFAG